MFYTNRPTALQLALFLLIIIAIPDKLKAQLTGFYTIDGTKTASSTNYKSITAAVADLSTGSRTDGGPNNGKGVKGRVIFKIANGIYNEQLALGAISGASSMNTITFQSASGDSSKVEISFASSSLANKNFTLQLKGAAYINFSKITISRTGNATYGHVAEINGNSHHDSFSHCIIKGVKTATSTYYQSDVYSDKDADSNIYFGHNLIKYGYNGIYFLGVSYKSFESGTFIEKNIFDSCIFTAVYLSYQKNPIVKENSVTNLQAIQPYALYFSNSTGGAVVSSNKIILNGNGLGIYGFDAFKSKGSDSAIIANNMISVLDCSGYGEGIASDAGEEQYILHNSVYVAGSSASTYCMTISNATNYATVLNNSLVNMSQGFAIADGYGNSFKKGDNNNLYTSGAWFANIGGNLLATFKDWQNISLLDAASISTDPKYFSSSDLHVHSIRLNSAGTVCGIPQDIDHEARNLSKPDIGADEFTPAALDAAVLSVDSPYFNYCAGSYPIYARIMNNGSTTLTSITINWSVNSAVQTAFVWTGSLASGKDSLIKIGSFTFSKPLKYKIKIYSSSPNGGTDAYHGNDTVVKGNILPGLSGTYTIGSSGADYSSFSGAARDLNTKGVCGPVVFNVFDGTYKEQVFLDTIKGSSATNSILFQSKSGDSTKVVLSWPSGTSGVNNYLVHLRGSDWVTFNKMSFERTGSNMYFNVIEIDSGACNNTFSNNRLYGGKMTPWTNISDQAIFCSVTTSDTANRILNNYMHSAACGVFWMGDYYYPEGGTQIRGNVMDSISDYGFYGWYETSVSISGNTIIMAPKNTSSYPCGIYLSSSIGHSLKILENKILMPDGGNGIYLDYTGDTAVHILLANNFITVSGSRIGFGMDLSTLVYADVFFNNINVTSTNPDNGAFCQAQSLTAPTFLYVKNNNFVNTGGGISIVTNAQIEYSDFNNLYTNGPILCRYGSTGFTDLATLADWFVFSGSMSGGDSNSVSADPLYYSATNLHVRSSKIESKGISIKNMPTDIDGEVRNLKLPDIGADEFNLPKTDIGIKSIDTPGNNFCPGSNIIKITFGNFGVDTITKATLNWSVNGITQSPVAWTGSLITGQDTSLILSSFTFKKGNSYSIKVWTSQPNGLKDSIPGNDTAWHTNIYDGMSGTYIIDPAGSGDYTNFNSAVADLNLHGVCGPVIFNIKNGIYKEQVSVRKIIGSSNVNTVTFQSQSGDSSKVVLSWPSSVSQSNNYTFELLSASWVRVSKITMQRTGKDSCSVIARISGGSTNNIFSHNRFINNLSSSTFFNSSSIYSVAGLDSSNSYLNNYIKYGAYGICLLGSNAVNIERHTLVQNNIVDSCVLAGIHLAFQEAPYVLDNTVTNIIYPTGYGIAFNLDCYNGIRCLRNKIIMPHGGTGITVSDFGVLYKSIYVFPSGNDTDLVANNFISVTNTNSYYPAFGISGIKMLSISYLKIYHNNIYLNSANANSAGMKYYFDDLVGGAGWLGATIFIYNNNVNCLGKASAISANKGAISWADYNNLYAPGNNIGDYKGVTYTTLKDWQFGTGWEMNGVSADPKYTSPVDLHTSAWQINNAGTPLFDVKTDIDGEIRNLSNPDIGADEFKGTADDVAMVSILTPQDEDCGDSNTVVTLLIKNSGANTTTSFPVYYTVNGSSAFAATAPITAPGIYDTISFAGKFNSYSGGIFKIKAWTAMPKDLDHSNDTISLQIKINAIPAGPVLKSDTICYPGFVNLTSLPVAGGYTQWYDSLGGPAIATGDTFRKSILKSKQFYTSYLPATPYSAGLPTPNAIKGTNSIFIKTSGGLEFNVAKACVLDSLTIYPDSVGTVKIDLYDELSNLIARDSQQVFPAFSGQAIRIGLHNLLKSPDWKGFDIPAGNLFTILYNDSGANRPRLQDIRMGAPLPYPFGYANGIIKIQAAFFSTRPTWNYPFFFNWKIRIKGCESLRVPVMGVVNNPTPPINIKKGLVFNGTYSAGTNSAPDKVCQGAKISYEFPTNASNPNSQYGKTWKVSKISVQSAFGSFITQDTATFIPTSSKNYRLEFSPGTATPDSLYLLNLEFSTIGSSCTYTLQRYIKVLKAPDARWLITNSVGLSLRFSPMDSNATGNSYLWDFGDTSTSLFMQQKHKYKANGIYQVKLSVTDAQGCTASDSSTIKLFNTSMDGPENLETDLNISPNPFQDKTMLSYSITLPSRVSITLTSAEGKIISLMPPSFISTGKYKLNIDAFQLKLAAGPYQLHFWVNGYEQSRQIIYVK